MNQPYPQQYPPAPAPQGYPAQPQPGYPAAPAPQQYQQPIAQPYAPPAGPYGQPPMQGGYPQQGAPQAPAVQLAQGSIDDFYNQPSVGGGPSLSWSKDGQQKPIGTVYVGVVGRDITSADIQQETDQRSGAPKTFRDGRPKFVMKVPLERVQGNYATPTGAPEYPDGEATWWVKGQSRDELTRAMAEKGVGGAPKKGAIIQVTLTGRKQGQAGMNPANQVQVIYTPAGTETPLQGGAPAVAQAPAQPEQVQQMQAPAPQPVAPQMQAQPVQQEAAPQWAQPAPVGQPQLAQPVQQAAPQPQAALAPQPHSGVTPEAAAIIAQLTGQQG